MRTSGPENCDFLEKVHEIVVGLSFTVRNYPVLTKTVSINLTIVSQGTPNRLGVSINETKLPTGAFSDS